MHAACSPAEATPVFQHVLCVYPYRRELRSAGFFPPLGLECIAAVIEPYARAIDVVDLRKEAGHTTDFLHPETDLVCFSVNWDRDTEFLRNELLSVPSGVLVLVGGRHATEDPERWLSAFPNVDAVVRGDGEDAVAELCQGVPLEEIAGFSFRKDGRIIHNPNRKLGPLRDEFHPNRRLRRYVYEIAIEGVSTGLPIDTISSSRGCPFNCTFCSFSRNPRGEKRNWSARSPESVVEELGRIDAPIVGFTDDLVTHDMDRIERICELILARGIRKKYIINARVEIARRPDILRKMERAGFVILLLGIESAQDSTLRSMRKGFDTAQVREYFKVLRERRMFLHGYFILGNIGETVDQMRRIVPFAHELGLDTLALTMLRASPHSGLDELVRRTPEYHITRSGKIYSDDCSVKKLRALRHRFYYEFYTVSQVLHVIRKAGLIGAQRFLPDVLPGAPRFAWGLGKYFHQRRKRRARKRDEQASLQRTAHPA